MNVTFVDHVGKEAGGAEQTLFTFMKYLPPSIVSHAVLFEDGAFAQRLRSLGIEVDIVPVSSAIVRATRERLPLRAALAVPFAALRVASIMRRRGTKLVYTNSMKAHIVGSLASRLAGLPCVMHFHDNLEGAALRTLQSAALFGSRERIACSQTTSETIAVGSTTVVYSPVEMGSYAHLPEKRDARRRIGLPEDGLPVVSIIGRINRWKGHDRFVRIAAMVNAVMPVRFVIVGSPIFRDADFLPEIEALVDSLGLRERVTFVPWLDDVRTAYAATDLNANCSTREPFGRSIVEAGACGVPSICFDDSGAAETILDNVTGRRVRAGDEAAFAEAIMDFLRDPDLLARARRSTLEATTRFDAPVIAGEIARVIHRAAG